MKLELEFDNDDTDKMAAVITIYNLLNDRYDVDVPVIPVTEVNSMDFIMDAIRQNYEIYEKEYKSQYGKEFINDCILKKKYWPEE